MYIHVEVESSLELYPSLFCILFIVGSDLGVDNDAFSLLRHIYQCPLFFYLVPNSTQ